MPCRLPVTPLPSTQFSPCRDVTGGEGDALSAGIHSFTYIVNRRSQ